MTAPHAALYPDCGLPRDLGDGLLLRWGTPDDAEAVAAFNVRIHSADPADPEEDIEYATRDLIGGRHPTTQPADFTVVVDRHAGDRIASCMLLLSQTWAYDGLPFAFGRPEWVGTAAPYRRRGLVRAQFAAIHARSAARGELVQGITGIPWYYRQFGYALALDRAGGRVLPWARLPALAPSPPYRLRPATAADLPLLARLYEAHCAASLISRVRTPAEWHWELSGTHEKSMYHRRFAIVEDRDGHPAGYAQTQFHQRTGTTVVGEVAAMPGHPLRAVCTSIAHAFKAEGAARAAGLVFGLGGAHPAYDALGDQLETVYPPSAWYMRVGDPPAFLRYIAPVLERRLRQSVMDGYTGTLRLTFFSSHLTLVFDRGTLAGVGSYEPRFIDDADACFPELTFLHLLFGHRSLADLRYAFPDCRADGAEAAVLLPILFPMRPSTPVMLG
jgi:hypothetical protein